MIMIGWIIFCIVVAYGASNRGRSGVGWFVISILATPIIAAIMLLILGPVRK